MKVNPIRDRILIKPEDKDTVTSSGIVIPDSAAEKPLKGKVLAVGTGKIAEDGSIIPLVIKEGDTVLFGKTAGQTIKIEDVEHLILREEEIMAIVQ
jgi:chaperonin GroES